MIIVLSCPADKKEKVKNGLMHVLLLIRNKQFKILYRKQTIIPSEKFVSNQFLKSLKTKSLYEIISFLSSIEFLCGPEINYSISTISSFYLHLREVKRFKNTFFQTCLEVCKDFCFKEYKINDNEFKHYLKLELL